LQLLLLLLLLLVFSPDQRGGTSQPFLAVARGGGAVEASLPSRVTSLTKFIDRFVFLPTRRATSGHGCSPGSDRQVMSAWTTTQKWSIASQPAGRWLRLGR
jgi:hypothetical protein